MATIRVLEVALPHREHPQAVIGCGEERRRVGRVMLGEERFQPMTPFGDIAALPPERNEPKREQQRPLHHALGLHPLQCCAYVLILAFEAVEQRLWIVTLQLAASGRD